MCTPTMNITSVRILHHSVLLPQQKPAPRILRWCAFPFSGGRRRLLCTAASNGPIVQPPDKMNEQVPSVQCYWQRKTKVLGENPVPVSFGPLKIPHSLPWDRGQKPSTSRPDLWSHCYQSRKYRLIIFIHCKEDITHANNVRADRAVSWHQDRWHCAMKGWGTKQVY